MARASKPRSRSPSTSKTVTTASIPSPFSAAPSSLHPFLSTLDPSKVYIAHIDRHPRSSKQQVFAVPVFLNLLIAVLLLWRTTHAVPTYIGIAASALGHYNAYTIDVAYSPSSRLVRIIAGRAIMFLLDWALVRFALPWPVTFLLERPENPVSWRWKCGFREREVYVRVSRNWGVEELVGDGRKGKGGKDGEEMQSVCWQEKVMPAVERAYVRSKTGYMMMDQNWDLDFGAMVTAMKSIDSGKVDSDQFEKSVLCYGGPEIGWLVWEVWKLDEEQSVDQEEARKNIVAFKDRLTAMGKESLFFRWIEIVQYESSQPGGFTNARQTAAVNQARELFQGQGIDFDEFVGDIGGKEGLPGMEARE